ncbi:MAG TPA: hypothetical protein VGJ96_11500 [Gemmatimonadaceae bacterium]|jgi:hypothetical protein
MEAGGIFVGQIITAAGLILGVLLAYLQVQKNHAAALKLQEAHLRNDLKLRLYDRVSERFSTCSSLLSKAHFVHTGVFSAWHMRVRQGFSVAPQQLASEMSETAHAGAASVNAVLEIVEHYEIAFPRFETIRRELSEKHRELLAAQTALWNAIMMFLPFADATTGTKVGPLGFPTEIQLAEFGSLHTKYQDVCNDISGYMIDLQIEAQNELLGELFGRTVPPRSPLDPVHQVLARDPSEVKQRPPGRLI